MEKMLHGVLVIIVVSLLTFVSCVPENDVPGVANSNGTSGLNGTEQGSWNNDLVNTAATSTYMSALEQQVIFEMNKARTNPALYAQLYIEPMLAHFSGKIFTGYGYNLLTNEGVAAVSECIAEMKKQSVCVVLQPAQGLAKTAQEWVSVQGPTGETGHGNGANSFSNRISRYSAYTGAGENISYGYDDAQKIVIQLLVDDGVADRGHRKNIFGDFTHAGVGCGTHKTYSTMCVIDFAKNYSAK